VNRVAVSAATPYRPRMTDLDAQLQEAPPRPFPSAIEIIGGLAALVPFFLHLSSSSTSHVNGQAVSFVYRDWVAVGGGAVAALCALAAVTGLPRTAPARRAPRGAAIVVLLGLGVYHLLGGFGLVGPGSAARAAAVGPAPDRTVETAAAPSSSVAPGPSQADLEAATRHVLDLWRTNAIKQVYDEAHPKFRSAVSLAMTQAIHDDLGMVGGSLLKMGAPLSYSGKDRGDLFVKGPAEYEKGAIEFTLTFHLLDAKPLLYGIHFEVPKPMQMVGNADDAVKIARRMLDALLQDKLLLDAVHPDLPARLGPPAEFELKLKTVLDQIGKVRAVKLTNQHECNGQCLAYDLAGAKSTGTATFEVEWAFAHWRIRAFDVSPPQKKK